MMRLLFKRTENEKMKSLNVYWCASQIDNKGNHLLVHEESSINVPAIAAAHVIKRYNAQASDELSFEVIKSYVIHFIFSNSTIDISYRYFPLWLSTKDFDAFRETRQ